MRPLILLDVDGVVNAFGSDRFEDPEAFEHEFTWHSPNYHSAVRVRVPIGTGARLCRLAEDFEIRWFTAWEENAHKAFGERLGLPGDWDHNVFEGWDGFVGLGNSWKLPWLKRVGDEDPERPLVWVDDDIRGDAETWARERPGPTLLVRCDPNVGLTDAEVDRMRSWLANVTVGAA